MVSDLGRRDLKSNVIWVCIDLLFGALVVGLTTAEQG